MNNYGVGLVYDQAMGHVASGVAARHVADSLRAKRELGWTPQYGNLEPVIDWNWILKHPNLSPSLASQPKEDYFFIARVNFSGHKQRSTLQNRLPHLALIGHKEGV